MMKRRTFLWRGALLTTGYTLSKSVRVFAEPGPVTPDDTLLPEEAFAAGTDLYAVFKDPASIHRPFVRWWWNGNKVEKEELARELRLMKDAGIGGVEINPIKFPARTSDIGKQAIQWLSPEWTDLLQFTLKEAELLGLTCDLIVGSGWPFGAEYLQGEERSQVVVTAAIPLEGPQEFEVSLFDLFKEADPAITSPYTGRTVEMLSVKLVPAVFTDLKQVVELSDQIPSGIIKGKIAAGKFMLYGLIKVHSFMEVINGAPGANGPVLNHFNEAAVKRYLNNMSSAIQQRIGPLSGRVRSFFTDSMELEGANWCADMQGEFLKRRGYDLMPYIPFTMGKTGPMGNTYDYNYGAEQGAGLKDIIQRVRYDFDLTQAELIQERFIRSFTEWCRENKIKSRVQAYGRGYFPLEGSFDIDLPECETWIKYGLGKEMSETDYRVGRAYTMINKYVSSAAHLRGKRHISCEELTNTDMVFNDTLEILKVAGDQSTISGVTHPIFHGFNYSPPDAPFPGWVRYGTYFNERNTWWPYFRQFTDYKARFSALLQEVDMFADIAVLPPVTDMWSLYGAQNEPFPSLIHPAWQSLIWESIHQNGGGCDYISEGVIRDADMREGWLKYGSRKYHTIFLIDVQRMEPAAAEKLLQFVMSGGRVFCIGACPEKSPGLKDFQNRDRALEEAVSRMKGYADRFILLDAPLHDFPGWYRDVQAKYGIGHYVTIDKPNPFVTQVRYQARGTDFLLFINSSLQDTHAINISPAGELTSGRRAWIWDAVTGERYLIDGGPENILLDLGPAESRLIVFDKAKKGRPWKPAPAGKTPELTLAGKWTLELRHIDGTIRTTDMDTLKDMKDVPDLVSFSGTVIYRNTLKVDDPVAFQYLNLGQVAGVSELIVNGKAAGAQWYGRRIYPLGGLLQKGNNQLEVKVVTSMGNYMKTLKDNPIAQYWTNEKRKNQPIQSMGLIGPVTLY